MQGVVVFITVCASASILWKQRGDGLVATFQRSGSNAALQPGNRNLRVGDMQATAVWSSVCVCTACGMKRMHVCLRHDSCVHLLTSGHLTVDAQGCCWLCGRWEVGCPLPAGVLG
jgi:hypothetical protein